MIFVSHFLASKLDLLVLLLALCVLTATQAQMQTQEECRFCSLCIGLNPCAYACATKDDPAYLNRKDIASLGLNPYLA